MDIQVYTAKAIIDLEDNSVVLTNVDLAEIVAQVYCGDLLEHMSKADVMQYYAEGDE